MASWVGSVTGIAVEQSNSEKKPNLPVTERSRSARRVSWSGRRQFVPHLESKPGKRILNTGTPSYIADSRP